MSWIAALPMYDYPELRAAHDVFWGAVAARLTSAGVQEVPAHLTRDMSHVDTWRHPRLLLGQACEYPLAKTIVRRARPVATPRYGGPGCEGGAQYRSAIVVRSDAGFERLEDLQDRSCAVNESGSNSGMNLLRAAIAPLSGGGRFFGSVTLSGSHRRSAEMVAGRQADVAALDCISFAHFHRLFPELVANLRVLCWTEPTPSPPFITARATDDATVEALRTALGSVMADPALMSVREELLLEGFDFAPSGDFAAVLNLERRAAELAYPVLQ
jgi:ABC-type phosphate/phosphonate transport system substrate-binding protein